jgi:hypothetical protein
VAEVVTVVSGIIEPERANEVIATYSEALKDGPPPFLEETFLVKGQDGEMAIISVWHRRADLDALLASGEEPFARRLIRTAGGSPEARIYEIVTRSTSRSAGRA